MMDLAQKYTNTNIGIHRTDKHTQTDTHTHTRTHTHSPRLTVFLGLEGDLTAFLLALGVGQRQPHVHGPEGRQVAQREMGRVALNGQAFPHGGVVPRTHRTATAAATTAAAVDAAAAAGGSAPTCGHGVTVAEGDAVAVATGQVVAEGLPLQGQLPRLDLRGGEAAQGPHGL